MLHLLVGRVTDVTPGSYENKQGRTIEYVEVTVACGQEACITRGSDGDYSYDEKVALKVRARAFGGNVQYDRLCRMPADVAASDIALFGSSD